MLDSFLGEQAGGDQHRRIRSVRATGNGGDHDAAVMQVSVGASLRLAPSLPSSSLSPAALLERSPAFDRTTRSCGRFGPARRLDSGKIETQQFGVFGFGRVGVVKESLLARVSLDERDLLVAAPGEAAGSSGFLVDGEDAAGCAVFGRHVGDGRAIGERQVLQAGTKEFDEFADDAMLAQHLGDGEHEIGGGGAFAQAAGAASRRRPAG